MLKPSSVADSPLYHPLEAGDLKLRNRIVMAPLTRGRATSDATPTPIMAEYYGQRAGAGLIVSEATAISAQGVGWVNAPGMFTDAHEEAWQPVTEAVHREGGRMVLQLWHMGRVSHPDFLDGGTPVGPSAIAAQGDSHTPKGKKPYTVPRALTAEELPGVAADYASASRRAIRAGFDGVEIHGANGYLLDQFVRDGSNQRSDAYGGAPEGRWAFPLEVARAVVEAIGAGRVGYRVSPVGAFNDMRDSHPLETFTYGAKALGALGLAYLHVIDVPEGHFLAGDQRVSNLVGQLRDAFGGVTFVNGGQTLETANEVLRAQRADAIAFGVPFIANPDLPARFRNGWELNDPNPKTFYTPGPEGYTDYPPYDAAA